MSLHNRSVATIDRPEFINLQPNAINPGISKCEIKVFYLGKNRNGSYIDRNTAIQMCNSLGGTPIVAAFHKDKGDFGDHGEVIHIEDGEIEFSCKTVPYGFVAPDAEVWFKKFEDTDEFGNTVTREYVMTTGYLWTGQYPELDKLVEGQPQSMEIEVTDGHWATDNNSGVDFFIINDAEFTKLCILGDDVEPCFEGASVIAEPREKTFAAKATFGRTLFSMMNDLKNALENKGGSYMPNEKIPAQEEAVFEAAEEVEEAPVETTEETFEAEEGEAVEELVEDGNDAAEEFAKDDKKEEDDTSDDSADSEDKSDSNSDEEDKPAEDDKKKTQKNSLEDVTTQLSELMEKFNALNEEVESLRAFKAERVDADKDALIAKYHMLSDEDKAEVIAHKNEFSLDEIEAKLALIYVQKNVDFDTVDGQAEVDAPAEAAPVAMFSLDNDDITEAGEEDMFLNALRETTIL